MLNPSSALGTPRRVLLSFGRRHLKLRRLLSQAAAAASTARVNRHHDARTFKYRGGHGVTAHTTAAAIPAAPP
eukprot:638193-Rhodomonas_salina.13